MPLYLSEADLKRHPELALRVGRALVDEQHGQAGACRGVKRQAPQPREVPHLAKFFVGLVMIILFPPAILLLLIWRSVMGEYRSWPVRLYVRVDHETKERLESLAREKSVTLNELLREAIQKMIDPGREQGQ
jgi:hypothetical protein